MTLRSLLARVSSFPRVRALYKAVKPLPVLGAAVQRLVPFALPGGTRVWAQVQSGPGEGLWLNLDPRYEQDFLEGNHELSVQGLLERYLARGATVYDVGGHIGFISMIAARLVGQRGKVFAFEADPENAARIQEHARRNGLAQVEVVPLAVWSQCGRVVFEEPSRSSARCRGKVVATPASRTRSGQIEVEAITLDSFAQDRQAPSLIKVDVEGAEAQVLEGARAVFDDAKPILIVEVHHQQAEAQVEGWLREKGYVLEWLKRGSDFPRHLLASPFDAD